MLPCLKLTAYEYIYIVCKPPVAREEFQEAMGLIRQGWLTFLPLYEYI